MTGRLEPCHHETFHVPSRTTLREGAEATDEGEEEETEEEGEVRGEEGKEDGGTLVPEWHILTLAAIWMDTSVSSAPRDTIFHTRRLHINFTCGGLRWGSKTRRGTV